VGTAHGRSSLDDSKRRFRGQCPRYFSSIPKSLPRSDPHPLLPGRLFSCPASQRGNYSTMKTLIFPQNSPSDDFEIPEKPQNHREKPEGTILHPQEHPRNMPSAAAHDKEKEMRNEEIKMFEPASARSSSFPHFLFSFACSVATFREKRTLSDAPFARIPSLSSFVIPASSFPLKIHPSAFIPPSPLVPACPPREKLPPKNLEITGKTVAQRTPRKIKPRKTRRIRQSMLWKNSPDSQKS
jgi:hypothetical protein